MWLPLYRRDEGKVIRHIGAGLGLDYPPIAVVPLGKSGDSPSGVASAIPVSAHTSTSPNADRLSDRPLTMSEAKRGLALTFGVPESAIRITIEA